MLALNVLALSALAVATVCAHHNPALKEVFHWKKLDFDYPDETARSAAVAKGYFSVENALPLGVEVWQNKLFVTVPRWKSGIPASLTYIDLAENEKNPSPLLKPYPDWKTHAIHDKDNSTKIISTFRVRADECDRLWVLDTGLANILGGPEQITPPKIIIYDLKTNNPLHTFEFNSTHIKENSFFANIVVDVDPAKCGEAFAYIPDLGSYAVIVYNLAEDTSFRVQHHFFYMDPLQGNYNVGGINFQWTDGIFSLALAPRNPDGSRKIYFHPLSSNKEFTVDNRVLQNETAANSDYYAYKVLGTRGPNSQATASFLDPHTGVMLYTQLNKNGVGCWNSYTHADDYSPETNYLVASDNETMIFPNDLKVDRDSNLWVLTDRLPTHIYKKLNFEETNYRIFKGKIEDLTKGTVCEVKKHSEPIKEEVSSSTSTSESVSVSSSSSSSTTPSTSSSSSSSTEKA